MQRVVATATTVVVVVVVVLVTLVSETTRVQAILTEQQQQQQQEIRQQFQHHDHQRRTNDFVKKVHIIFMNHLDVGYASFANNILNEYFVTYFARAAKVAADLEAGGFVETFIYTTHPWLVSLYLDCPPNLVLAGGVRLQCPNATQLAAFINSINKGIITWHAGPMNLQPEMAADLWLFEAGLDIAAELDARFNITRKVKVLSQRDVPGMTQAVIPSLIKKGIVGVSVGVNPGTPPPAVPSLFVWEHPMGSVLGTWHKGGYPNNPGGTPSSPGGISRGDCVVVEGFEEALCFAFRGDNTGPPVDYKEVLSNYEIVRAEFPNAELQASRFEDFFAAALSIKDKLPVVTNEIGDTWIQGVASDPRKCAEYRAVSRVMGRCFSAGKCLLSDVRVWNSTRFLIKLPEHTWGLPSEGDQIHWSNMEFYKYRLTAQNFLNSADSWLEQREFTYLAIDALTNHSVVEEINQELDQLMPHTPDLAGYDVVSDHSKVFQCPKGNIKSLQFGSDGSIISLNYNNIDWASPGYSLGSFVYTTYNETDFDDFAKVYTYNGWNPGYYKSNLTRNFYAESKTWGIQMNALYASKSMECEFYVSAVTDMSAVSDYGAPLIIWMHYTVRDSALPSIPGLDIEFQWFQKTITRLPEALSLSFKLKPQPNYNWMMSKMNSLIDPHTVLLNGSQYQHVVDDQGVWYMKQGASPVVKIRSLDVPLVCPVPNGSLPHIFPAPLGPVTEDVVGMSFNFYNNIWDTNYIMWYPYTVAGGADFRARFRVDFTGGSLDEHYFL